VRLVAAILGCGMLACVETHAQESLDVVVARMAAYVERFQTEFGAVVAEERYEQDVRSSGSTGRGGVPLRTVLRSDFLLVRIPGEGWLPFRDVFERDGRPVRDREDRLGALFLNGATANALEQGRRIMNESARYNIGNGTRNTNIPTLALMFLTPSYVNRMEFAEARDRAADTRSIDFKEIGRPTLIRTTNDRNLPVHGRLLVEEATGTILRAELHAEDTQLESEITVIFQPDKDLGVAVPARMEERFKRRGDSIEVRGVATYAKFRRFQVTTSEQLDPPPDSDSKSEETQEGK